MQPAPSRRSPLPFGIPPRSAPCHHSGFPPPFSCLRCGSDTESQLSGFCRVEPSAVRDCSAEVMGCVPPPAARPTGNKAVCLQARSKHNSQPLTIN